MIRAFSAFSIEFLETAESAAQRSAAIITDGARNAVAPRGRFAMAVSGGHKPWLMLGALASADVPWRNVFVAEVDERVARAGRAGHLDRNLLHLLKSGLDRASLAGQIKAMPCGGC